MSKKHVSRLDSMAAYFASRFSTQDLVRWINVGGLITDICDERPKEFDDLLYYLSFFLLEPLTGAKNESERIKIISTGIAQMSDGGHIDTCRRIKIGVKQYASLLFKAWHEADVMMTDEYFEGLKTMTHMAEEWMDLAYEREEEREKEAA